jgi:hypothetical protein
MSFGLFAQNRPFSAACLLIRPLNSVEVSHPFRKKRGKDGARGQYLWAESIAAEGMQVVENAIPSGAKAHDPLASFFGTTEVVP